MIETHRYEITFKKEDLHVELSSDDERFISRQMNQWFRTILEENDFPPLPRRTPRN